MKYLFLTLTSKRHDHHGNFTIERCDLTRKLDCLNTWVPEVLDKGHEVLFFDGGNAEQYYDEDSLTLHLTESDEYELRPHPSRLYKKIQAAFRWALENKEFDYAYLHDDDIYINIHEFEKINVTHDYRGNNIGGNGFFFNKKSMKAIVDYDNKEFHVADHAIYNCIEYNKELTKTHTTAGQSEFYVPGELYATIHYVSGRRFYFLDNMLRFYRENGYTNRKIIVGFPFASEVRNPYITYEVEAHRKTKRDYDFVFDKNNWEYHIGYCKSALHNVSCLREFWPYAKNATKHFVVNLNLLTKYYEGKEKIELTDFLINKFEESLINKDNLIICSDPNENPELNNDWKLDNSVKDSLKLNFEHLASWNFYKRI